MTCDHYWREGVVLVERGLDDPHRAGCAECARAHASRQELIEALPQIAPPDAGDPAWQVKVWRQIDGEHRHSAPRWRWALGAALAAACTVVLCVGLGRTRIEAVRPRFVVITGGVAMRSISDPTSAHVDDRLRVTAGVTSEVWIYRAGRLVRSCRARQVSEGCTRDAGGMTAELVLSIPGEHQVIVVDASAAGPRGGLDEDRAALESAGVHYEERPLLVH